MILIEMFGRLSNLHHIISDNVLWNLIYFNSESLTEFINFSLKQNSRYILGHYNKVRPYLNRLLFSN